MKFKPDNEIIGYVLNGVRYCGECGKRINKIKTGKVTREETITVYDACGTQHYECDECGQSINFLAVAEW